MLRSLFPQRIARGEFCIRFVLLLVAYLGASFLGLPLASVINPGPTRELVTILAYAIPLFLFVAYFFFGVLIPRLRDVGLPSWYLVFYLVPLLNLFLIGMAFFAPSDSWNEGKDKVDLPAMPTTSDLSVQRGNIEDPY